MDPIGFVPSGNLDLAELAVPILVFGIVAQAVLVMQFVGDLIKRVFDAEPSVFSGPAVLQVAPPD
jgi:hypothetical protein